MEPAGKESERVWGYGRHPGGLLLLPSFGVPPAAAGRPEENNEWHEWVGRCARWAGGRHTIELESVGVRARERESEYQQPPNERVAYQLATSKDRSRIDGRPVAVGNSLA